MRASFRLRKSFSLPLGGPRDSRTSEGRSPVRRRKELQMSDQDVVEQQERAAELERLGLRGVDPKMFFAQGQDLCRLIEVADLYLAALSNDRDVQGLWNSFMAYSGPPISRPSRIPGSPLAIFPARSAPPGSARRDQGRLCRLPTFGRSASRGRSGVGPLPVHRRGAGRTAHGNAE